MRMLLCIFLNGRRHATIRVAFTQHGVYRATQHLRITRFDSSLFIVGRIGGIVRNIVALVLQFPDRGGQLRDRCTDIGQLDDVCFRRLCHFTQLGQGVPNLLIFG